MLIHFYKNSNNNNNNNNSNKIKINNNKNFNNNYNNSNNNYNKIIYVTMKIKILSKIIIWNLIIIIIWASILFNNSIYLKIIVKAVALLSKTTVLD